jgi:uncharacterized protein
MRPLELSAVEARRLALRAQGFGAARVGADLRKLRRIVERLHCIQIDAVNVLVRSHYLPIFSRVGPYDLDDFDRLAYRRRELFEYRPKNVVCLFPTSMYPLLRWCMDAAAAGRRWAELEARLAARRPGYIDAVLDEVRRRGPLAFTELSDPGRTPASERKSRYAASSLLWFSWADGDSVLNGLARAGRLAVAGRKGFEPQFDLAERVIPASVLAHPTPHVADAQRELVRRAAAAVGVGTVKDIAGYFRLPVAVTRARLRELLDAGDLCLAHVEDWQEAAYVGRGCSPKPVSARAVLSPFDSLLWERTRTRRLFGFEQVFELYVPADKRRYGYYVLPFLLDEALVGRVELKADRAGGRLLVPGAFAERDVGKADVAQALAAELRLVAEWLGLERIEVGRRGDLAPALRRALPAHVRGARKSKPP